MNNSNENKIVQSLWIGEKLSLMEQLCIQSFLQNGHEFHLYTYQNIENVPKGVKLLDGNMIIPEEKIFHDDSGIVAAFSDWFRYKLLYEKGGCWVDMDLICLKHIDIQEEYCFSTEIDQMQKTIVNVGFIKSPAKAEFLSEILKLISSQDHTEVPWGTYGPNLFGKVIELYGNRSYIKPPEYFCPINWFDTYQLISKQDYKPHQQTYAIHLWNEVSRRGCLDKNASYHPESIFEKLKERYKVY